MNAALQRGACRNKWRRSGQPSKLDAVLTHWSLVLAASRMRSRYRELLREEISQTLPSQEDVEDEIRSLFAALES